MGAHAPTPLTKKTMITKTQTDIEKRDEMFSERLELTRQFQNIPQRRDYIRACKKAKSFPFYYNAHYKSSNGNRYTIVVEATDRKKGSANPLMSTFTTLDTEEGKYMLRYDTVRQHVNIFTPHFFKRYRERFLKDNRASVDDVIMTFHKRNPNLPKDDKENVFIGRDGYILSKGKGEGIDICVTFVTYGMLKNGQIDLFKKGIERIDEVEKELEL